MTEIDIPQWLAWPLSQVKKFLAFGGKKLCTLFFMLIIASSILIFTRMLALRVVERVIQ
jgi:hypothetical protein